MNNNEVNNPMNVEDYENMAVRESNNAKRVAAGAALFVGGAAVAGGAAYAATNDPKPDEDNTLTVDDIVDGGNVGNEYQPEAQPEPKTERIIYVEKQPEPEPEPEPEDSLTWEEQTVIYDRNGNVVMSEETGQYNGHKFALIDADGDDHADFLAIDVDDNGRFDDNEFVKYEVSDHVHMGHDTPNKKEIYYDLTNNPEQELEKDDDDILGNDGDEEIIYNNFEDEKTGEDYSGDYAENNNDYNPNADVNEYAGTYTEENDGYLEEEMISDDSEDFEDEYENEESDYMSDASETDSLDPDSEMML